jgi:hypothetical protein
MASAFLEFTLWMLILPAGFGLMAFAEQKRLVSHRIKSSGYGWTAINTFEVKNAIFSAAAFGCPVAAVYVFSTSGIDMPTWQWWSAMGVIGIIAAIPMQFCSVWSNANRKKLGL